MHVIVITCLLAVAAATPTFDKEFNSFLTQHGKSYDDADEHQRRFQIYADNHQMITEHNRRHALNQTGYTMAINRFADLLPHEYHLSCLLHSPPRSGQRDSVEFSPGPPPDTVDWRSKGAVTPVKTQGTCKSCWAFSTTGTLEGQHFRKTGKLVSLSEQNLVDCAGHFGNKGCHGGTIDGALKYVLKNGGIDTEQSYPYVAKDGQCRFQKKTVGATVKAITELANGDERQLELAVAQVGPVAVAIDAEHPSFHFYHSGVYDEPTCSAVRLNHGVLAVGYGTDEKGGDYWLVKNSWSPEWGEAGYIRMIRNKGNQCGIASMPCYPVV